MLVQFCFLLASVFLGIVLAAPPMPEVVGTFPLTQALWNDLHDRSRFPLAWISDEFQGQPTETWREFLRVNGADTIQKEYVVPPRSILDRSLIALSPQSSDRLDTDLIATIMSKFRPGQIQSGAMLS